MGFPCSILEAPKLIADLLHLLAHFKFMVMATIFRLQPSSTGLGHPMCAQADQQHLHEEAHDHALSLNLPSPASFPPVPVRLSPIMLEPIKKRLSIVSFGDYVDRLGVDAESEYECAVCLNNLERKHEMRELSNCCHVFHRECLDKWVDQSCQATCPLCRMKLMPTQGGGDPWMVERMYYLFGEDW